MVDTLLSKNFDVINFGHPKVPKIITSEVFCTQKFKRPNFFKHYFSIKNLHTDHLNINE